MGHVGLIKPNCELTVGEIATLTRAKLHDGTPTTAASTISHRSIPPALPISLFFDKPKYVDALANTRAGACLIAPRFTASAPRGLALLETPHPFPAFVAVARKLFPEMLRPSSLFDTKHRAASTQVHPTARLEAGVTVDPLAVIETARRSRRRHLDRRSHSDRTQCLHRPRLLDWSRRHDPACTDRRPRHHPSRRSHWAGRLRLSTVAAGTPENPANPTGHHSGRCRNRRQHDHRPRRHSAIR